ncbi:unnamed protein product [Rhizophagus irregularis]|uniref:DUF8211 domain-containing protein n=1 Tax=Rhizophagus irregularis TaxID=588596 RepID=A0A2I1HBS5_9GLOM|nr:hypothetical protein RhiirA4_476464 [Rhizophagus irregularis]CAB4435724.1 unnamed protein product [Rhizophagus irregularis]
MVLSQNRRACISHQRDLEKFENIKSYSSNSAVSNLSPTQLHANLIYQRWKFKEMKHIYSNRLGIIYTSRYINSKKKLKDRNGFQYILVGPPLSYSSGQLGSYLDSKQKKHFSEYKSQPLVLMLAQNIPDTEKASPYTTPRTSSPPGARPEILDYDTAEEDVPTQVMKRNNQDFFTKVKRTKTTHSLSLPYMRAAESSLTNSSTSYNKKTKP